ncbi:hypothetical protein [Streptomyces sp. NPDC057428]|uniref:hypothetical protein n=1 Tax=Streptomyces sp. NPDC057428 TaxID=3346129 RepID=UPI003699346A
MPAPTRHSGRRQGRIFGRLGSAQQRNTWSTGEECAVEDLEVRRASPIAETEAGANMPAVSFATADRCGASMAEALVDR